MLPHLRMSIHKHIKVVLVFHRALSGVVFRANRIIPSSRLINLPSTLPESVNGLVASLISILRISHEDLCRMASIAVSGWELLLQECQLPGKTDISLMANNQDTRQCGRYNRPRQKSSLLILVRLFLRSTACRTVHLTSTEGFGPLLPCLAALVLNQMVLLRPICRRMDVLSAPQTNCAL